MDGMITGETQELIGLSIIDNNDAEHLIEMKFDGNITGHQCEAYADDPANRTDEENEHNNQARRFAKYYVYAERGYDTVAHVNHPDYIEAVRQAIVSLSDAQFEQFFSPIHQQLRSHHDSTVERPRSLPSAVRYPDDVIYKQDLYLGIDPRESDFADEARAIAADRGLDLEAGMTSRALTDVSASELEKWQSFADELADTIDPEAVDAELGLEDGAVSGIHVSYPDEYGELVTESAEDPLERQPDARLELLTADPGTLEEFNPYLDHHLRCQIRDCLVGMGLTPPAKYRVLGPGKFIYTRRYNHYNMYPELHSTRSNSARLFGYDS
ncbi:hypothetical protein [Natrinema limicola]|uniref:Uncharacterized protein n=1 Tax=Natrinema limicola JCM 13563 TaxID=1230457 RepID=M0CT50_9EURY|nr:hypothetical protein [Natrinema limicola]ELZ25843.1 hypothetical protein C476_00292 [Natrinema limicola JCM 13563]